MNQKALNLFKTHKVSIEHFEQDLDSLIDALIKLKCEVNEFQSKGSWNEKGSNNE